MVKRKAELVETKGKTGHRVRQKVQELNTTEEVSDIWEEGHSEENEEIENQSDESQDQSEDQSDQDDDEEDDNQKPVNQHQITASQLQSAREAAELFKSSVFKLQIDELLKELQIKEKHRRTLDKFLFDLNAIIQEIDVEVNLTLDQVDAALSESHIAVPFPDPRPASDIQYRFGFCRPSYINVVGSHALGTLSKQPERVGVDVVLTMPHQLFTAKDYLNYRYFHKRAFYLAYLAKVLKEPLGAKGVNLSFQYLHGDTLRPILVLTSDSKGLDKFAINLLLAAPSNVFDLKKLHPTKNCVRVQDQAPFATPRYNAALVSDCTYDAHLNYLFDASRRCAAFGPAAVLGRLWLRQRGLGSSLQQGGFGHCEFALLLAALLNNRTVLAGYSSYQLFRTALLTLADGALAKGVSFASLNGKATLDITASDQTPVLYDSSHHLNVTWKMSAASYRLLRHEAAVSCDLLDDTAKDRFGDLLLKNLAARPNLRFDLTFNVSLEGAESYSPVQKVQHQTFGAFVRESVCDLVIRGGQARIKAITSFDEPNELFKLNRRRPARPVAIRFGVLLDPLECDKLVTHGPAAEDEEATAQFRSLWKHKAELRRFQDTSIRETVVWEADKEKTIVQALVEFLVKEHLGLETQFGSSLVSRLSSSNVSAATAAFNAKHACFLKTAYMLHGLDLPLAVRSVQPVSSSLRFASVHVPQAFSVSHDDAIAQGVVEFESTSKWPDSLDAAERTKTALLLKMCELINGTEQSSGKYSASVLVRNRPLTGNGLNKTVPVGVLVVQTPEGFPFEYMVANVQHDVNLYTKAGADALTLHRYEQDYVARRLHNRTVHTLALRHPFFSPTVRLVKTWFGAHLLSNHLSPEAIELLTLKVFADSAPYEPPASVDTAFYRVLAFIAEWDWQTEPLVLDVDRAAHASRDNKNDIVLTGEDRTNLPIAAETRSSVQGTGFPAGLLQTATSTFEELRSRDPAFTHAPLFIWTKSDPSGVMWTQLQPPFVSDVGRLAVTRMSLLARAVQSNPSADVFGASLSDYNLVIHLVNPVQKGAFKNLALAVDHTAVAATNVFDRFYALLAENFGDSAVFFHAAVASSVKRTVIGGLWLRDVAKARKFRVNLGYSSIPVGKEQEVVINKEAIVHEIRRLGGDLIEKIVINA